MSSAVSNSGPLIHLAVAGFLRLLRKLYDVVFITQAVKNEVVDKGREVGAKEVVAIEEAMDEGWIKSREVAVPEGLRSRLSRAGLHGGEIETIALAIALAAERGCDVLLDDDAARIVARSIGLKVRGSIGILVEAVKGSQLNVDEGLEILDRISETMYLGVDAYLEAKRRLESLRRER